jgi:hypothetical protein
MQSLRAINQNDKANEVMELFSQKSANDGRAKLFKQNTNYLQAIKANSGRYTIEDAESIRSILIMELLFIRIN